MSETLSTEAPETDNAGAATATQPPVDDSAVVEGSATQTETVDAKRFNGLMAAHQEALTALASEREARMAAEARIEGNTPVTAESNETLEQVAALRKELAEQRLETQKAEILSRYPDAVPFADVISGSNASEIEALASAIAERAQALKAPAGSETEATEETSTEAATTAATTVAGSVTTAPVLSGGQTPPAEPVDRATLRQEALAEGSWDKFWQSASGPDVTQGLA